MADLNATYENIKTEVRGQVGIITLNRPEALNALCAALIREMAEALDLFEADEKIGCIIVTGSEKAFAAGADIKEMQNFNYMDVYQRDFISDGWERLAYCRKPTIAAVAGFALGGGCEIAMMCDMIIAAVTVGKTGPPRPLFSNSIPPLKPIANRRYRENNLGRGLGISRSELQRTATIPRKKNNIGGDVMF